MKAYLIRDQDRASFLFVAPPRFVLLPRMREKGNAGERKSLDFRHTYMALFTVGLIVMIFCRVLVT
jgi:hypothetical protein